jgi:hypothetical protein
VIHKPNVSPREVKFEVTCEAAARSVCQGKGQVLTVEKLLGKQIAGLEASESTGHHRQVVLGSERFSVKAGKTKTVVIELNGETRMLLSQFGHVPALLKLTLLNTRPPTVFTRNIEIKP